VLGEGPSGALQRRVDHLLEEFSAQPLQHTAFEELERLLRETARWGALAGVYECRFRALDEPEQQHDMLLRLARLLEVELDAPQAALERYRQARELGPRHAPTLAGMRRTLARVGDIRQALLVAEDEERLTTGALERARLCAEVAGLWSRLGSDEMARPRYEEALRLDRHCDSALDGLAALAMRRGDTAAATALYERRLADLHGAERAGVLERLAGLLPSSQRERARDLLRQVVAEFPERRSALEQLCRLERELASWDRVHELQQRIVALHDDADTKLEWALEAARIQLEEAGSVERALEWANAAAQSAPQDPRAQRLRARLFELGGQTSGLLDALEALERIEGSRPERALEIARLHQRHGRFDAAAAALRTLLEERPNDTAALVLLDHCLAALGAHP